MENGQTPRFSVSDFLAVVNQSLEVAFGIVEIEGEVSSFKVNHQKYVFFDLKDDSGSVACFMSVWQLRTQIEDGMRVVVRAAPKVTPWGKFSLTVQEIKPVGEGSIKRAQELLRQKLDKEGLFSVERKRLLPRIPGHIGVVSSVEAAGYKDFIKLLGERWGGLTVDVANVQVQGDSSPAQIVRAIEYFNSAKQPPEVIVIIRGGGAADDLAAFNDEAVVRAIATSRIPTLVGVGHETDETLSDLAADVRASTPSHAAQIIAPDRREVLSALDTKVDRVIGEVSARRASLENDVVASVELALSRIDSKLGLLKNRYFSAEAVMRQLDPRAVLRRGYAIVRTDNKPMSIVVEGDLIAIETDKYNIEAEVKDVQPKINR